MYDPVQDGIEKSTLRVSHQELRPPAAIANIVHNFWELKTDQMLADDFCLHAIPDACVNILFNQLDTDIAGVTALRTRYEALNLGKQFHYVGIQFYPGVWQGDLNETSDSYVGSAYKGELPLITTNETMSGLSFSSQQTVLTDLAQQFIAEKRVAINPVTEAILSNIASIHTVADMAETVRLSPRQLQRIMKRSTNLSPHDFLKVLRLQHSFKQHYQDLYTDQSHFIHCFRKITGYTPAEYYRKFDV